VVFLSEPPVDRMQEIYPTNYYSYRPQRQSLLSRFKAWMDRRDLGRVFRRVSGDRLRVLDVGGGVGFMASAAREADSRVVATTVVDLDESARRHAESSGHRFVASPIEDFRDPEQFDLILAYNLIEHVAAPRQVLRNMASFLSDNGRIVIKTPNIDSLDARIYRHDSWGGLHCPRHWVLYDESSFRAAAQSVGLEVVELRYTQGAPFWAVNLTHAAEARRWLTRPGGAAVMDLRTFRVAMAASAVFDLLRAPFAKTSQMIVVLAHARAP